MQTGDIEIRNWDESLPVERSLDEVGLGKTARLVIGMITLLPFVGLVIGGSYSFRRHRPTRKYGHKLLFNSLVLHLLYGCCICPTLVVLAALFS